MNHDYSSAPYTEDAPLSTRAQDGTPERRMLRAADADREAAAAALRQHYTEGRLDAVEYDERLARCYAARTLGELDALFPDLPRLSPVAAASISPTPYSPHSDQHPATRGGWQWPAVAPLAIVLIVVLVVVTGFAGAHHVWFAWPLLFFAFRFGGRGNRHRPRNDHP